MKSPHGFSQFAQAWEIGTAMWNHNTKQAIQVITTTKWHASLEHKVQRLYREVVLKECVLLKDSIQPALTTHIIESRLGTPAADINKGNKEQITS